MQLIKSLINWDTMVSEGLCKTKYYWRDKLMRNKKIIFSIVIVLFWFSLYAYVPQLTNYAKELGASYKIIGLIGGAYGLSQTIFRIPLGIASDALGKRKIFVITGIICAIVSSVIIYLFPSPYSLLMARFIAGIASATWVNFTILFISYYDSEESNKAVGIVTANSKLGQLLAMFISGFIALRFGVRTIFLVSILIGIVSLILSLIIYEDKIFLERTHVSFYGIFGIINNPRIIHISILAALMQLITYSTTFGFTPIIASNLGANNLQLGLLSTLFNLPQVLFSILASTLISKKIGEKNTLLLGFLLTTIVCFFTPIVSSLKILYILQLIAGAGNAIAFSLLMAMVIKGVESNLMNTTMGFFQAVFGIGMIVGPIILGSIGDLFGLTIGFIVVGVLGTFAMSTIFIIK